MRKILFSLFLCIACTMQAQEILVGDMNDDNQLSMGDVSTLVNTILGKTPARTVKLGITDPYAVDNTSLAGTWRTTAGEVITLGSDGSCSLGTGYTYEYMPAIATILILKEDGTFFRAYDVLKKTDKYLLLMQKGSATAGYYYVPSVFVSAIRISDTEVTLKTGKTFQLSATIEPADAMVPTIKWTSSNKSIATVSSTGKITAKKGGTCTITAATTDGTGLKATCTVTVIQLVTSVALNHTTLTVGKGSVFALDATVLPENADNKAVTWSSSNTSAVMDLGNGEFYAKAAGTSTITATAADGSGKKATCTVTVLSVMPTAISMSEPSVTIKPTETTQLSATITPSTASDVTLVWKSSNPEVATVSNTGLVTATEAEGVTTITATIAGASTLVATAKVYVTLHDFVDLGLPSGTLWATCNIGAENPEDYGDYFAWGETTGYNSGKTTFNWSTYTLCNGSSSTMKKYCTNSSYGTVDNKTELDPEDDAAYVNWGSVWRMPTRAQWDELYNSSYTTTTWTTLNGEYGRKISKKSDSNVYIFLPAAGYRGDSRLNGVCGYGNYWSRSLITSSSYSAYYLYFDSSYLYTVNNDGRYYGRSVRPVFAK